MKINRDNTHKKNIINNICKEIGLPANYVVKIVDDLISICNTGIHLKKKIKIKNFGTFLLKKKKKRIGRNPKDKINHEISERNVVTFKAADVFKKKINLNASK